MNPKPDKLAERPSASQLFLIFARIGLTSFGGGLSALGQPGSVPVQARCHP